MPAATCTEAEVMALEEELVGAAAQVHAAMAVYVTALARFRAASGWEGPGIRTLGQWGDIALGIPAGRVTRMAHVGARLERLPLLREAFAEGAVSYEKVALVARVATADTDQRFTYLARAGSYAQLSRICEAYRDATKDDDGEADPESPEKLQERHEKCGVSVTTRDDGLVRIVALLEPDDAALVVAAMDARVEAAWRRDRPDSTSPAPDLSERRAVALVELATEGLVEGPDPVVRGERVEVRVHVDEGVLDGTRPDGRCSIEGIGPVPVSTVRRLICDASVRSIREQIDGIFNLGRSQRTCNRRQRRALNQRDGGCRFPGCTMRRFVDAHHVVLWDDGGFTDMDNLVLLCAFHHRLFHEGGYAIESLGGGRFTFRRPDGTAVETRMLRARETTGPPPRGCPRAEGGGERYDLDLTVDVLLQ
jgi:hypothetical protein